MNNSGIEQQVIKERELKKSSFVAAVWHTHLRIREDKWIPYYSGVYKWSNLYAYQIGLSGSYGHGFKPMKLPEFFWHDVFILMDGIQGGTSGTLYRLYQMGADYYDDIAQEMDYWRSIQIKRLKKNLQKLHSNK